MTKRDEAVFIKAFDKMEAEGFFDELREKARARKLQEKARAEAKPTQLKSTISVIRVRETHRGEFEAKAETIAVPPQLNFDSAIRVAIGKSEESKPSKRPRKKAQASVLSQNVADKVPIAASKK